MIWVFLIRVRFKLAIIISVGLWYSTVYTFMKLEGSGTVSKNSNICKESPVTLKVSACRWINIISYSCETMTDFRFNVYSGDWQLTIHCMDSPAITSTHLVLHAAQNKQTFLQIASDPPTPAGVVCISAPDGWNQLFLTHPLKLQLVRWQWILADRSLHKLFTPHVSAKNAGKNIIVFKMNCRAYRKVYNTALSITIDCV